MSISKVIHCHIFVIPSMLSYKSTNILNIPAYQTNLTLFNWFFLLGHRDIVMLLQYVYRYLLISCSTLQTFAYYILSVLQFHSFPYIYSQNSSFIILWTMSFFTHYYQCSSFSFLKIVSLIFWMKILLGQRRVKFRCYY